jgi:hypothetical protein
MNNRFLKFLDPTRITRKIRSIEDLKLVFRLIKKIVGVKAGKGKIWENP